MTAIDFSQDRYERSPVETDKNTETTVYKVVDDKEVEYRVGPNQDHMVDIEKKLLIDSALLSSDAFKAPHSSRTLRYAKRIAFSLILLLLIAGSLRFLLNHRNANALASQTTASLQRTVITTQASPGKLKRNVTLPATLLGNTETPVYARSSGYLASWKKNIGDHVKKGELLAVVDAPEQDQELAQARASREQIKARLNFAQLTLTRWESLHKEDGVSQQDLEEKRSAVIQAKADLAAFDANVKRLEQLKDFRHIVAPFDGVIVRRSVEVGNLVTSGSKELFSLAQIDPLRLTVWVPQIYASDINPGKEVNISLSEFPGKQFKATIERASGGIDPQTRSRQLDISLRNPDSKLLPGAYAEVDISLSGGTKALVVPASVLVISADGPRIAVVSADNRVTFRNVKVGRDLGREIEIVDGLTPQDKLVVSPSDLLRDGEIVKTTALKNTKKVAIDKSMTGNSTVVKENSNKSLAINK